MNNNVQDGIVGELVFKPISALKLDAKNPRFELADHERTQVDFANKLILGYEVMQLAESIARNGFIASEPLVAVVDETDPASYIVVEGNRRLTALKALCDSEFRKQLFKADEWEKLSKEGNLPENIVVPVNVVHDRSMVNPILAFRHISGINSWQPLAQARFIAKIVDEDGLNFEETAQSVGKSKSDVGNKYRDYALAREAAKIGFDANKVEGAFTLITVSMGSPALRDFVGVQEAAKIKNGEPAVAAEKHSELKELFTWLYGTENTEPVISDSREISKKLAKVVANPTALAKLRETSDLNEAADVIKETGMDPYQRLITRLRAAENAIKAALEDFPTFSGDPRVQELVESIHTNCDYLTDTDG